MVYQHSLTALALPLKLILPSQDLIVTSGGQTGSITTNGHMVNSASHNSQLNGHHHHHDESSTTTSANNSRQNTLSKQQSVQNTSTDGRQLLDKGAGKYTTLKLN